jgi:hypothetical protein
MAKKMRRRSDTTNPSFPTAALPVSGIKGLSHRSPGRLCMKLLLALLMLKMIWTLDFIRATLL